jgi:glycine/D-amino acid oxidase-like deaminating enzyme
MTTAADGVAVPGSLADTEASVYWLEDDQRPDPLPSLSAPTSADLVVVGGGYTGLWTALRSVERYPGSSVVVLDAGHCGDQASGRNGGFVSASLTHGFGNGIARWPGELSTLDRLGAENLAAIGTTIQRYGIDCHWETTGELDVALAPHQLEELTELAEAMAEHGHPVEMLDRAQTRALVNSPAYVGGLLDRTGTAMVEPARLAWGLRQACLDHGVVIHEGSHVTRIDNSPGAVVVHTAHGSVRAGHVALATNGFRPLLRRLRLMTVPVYDYVLMTEPLTDAQMASIGWTGRQGVGDSANQFHYYRLTRDNRILWGGYDAVYYLGSQISRAREQAETTHQLLAGQFFETFPQLEGLRFTHRWGGVIDTCTRFAAFFGTAYRGRVAYATGYTGLGVGATRFGADVMLDLLHREDTERMRSQLVREKPLPFPPEPMRYVGISLTRRALDQADRNEGKRNLWLRSLDKVGLGFDS